MIKKIALIILAVGMNVAASEQSIVPASSTHLVRRQATEKERGEFYEAIKLNDVVKVKSLLALGISPLKSRSMDPLIITFMGQAIDYQRLEIIDLFLDAGVDVNNVDKAGGSLVEGAIRWDKPDCFKHLIKRGADISNIKKAGGYAAAALSYPTSSQRKMAKILLDLNPAITSDNTWDDFYIREIDELKQELKREKKEMKTILMLHKKVGNEYNNLPWLAIEQLLSCLKGRHDYTGTSRTDLD